MANPTTITWVDPTNNVDGSPIAAGEITGYDIGVRPASGVAGTYPFITSITNPSATSELISQLGQILAPGSYFASVRATGAVDSGWAAEAAFTIAAPQPNPPSGLKVA